MSERYWLADETACVGFPQEPWKGPVLVMDACLAGSFSSTAPGCAGAMGRRSKVRTGRRTVSGSAGGAMDAFSRKREDLAAAGAELKTVVRRDPPEGAPHGIEPADQRGCRQADRSHSGGMNIRLHATTDAGGRPLSFVITAGKSEITSVRQRQAQMQTTQSHRDHVRAAR